MSYARPLFSSGSGSGSGSGAQGLQGIQGSTGPQGATGARGDAGGNGGRPLYLNYSQTSPAAGGTYKLLSTQQDISGNTINYPAGSSQTFLTYLPDLIVPGGIYSLNLFASATIAGTARIRFILEVVDSVGSYQSTISTSNFLPLSSIPLTTLSITAIGTAFSLTGGSQVFLTIEVADFPVNINYQYNNGNGYSYLQTTFTPQGSTGPQGATGATGAQGATGTPYWSLTGNQLYPTVITNNVGIGTQGSTNYALDVSGNLRTNADAYINNVRVGTGSGNIQFNTVLGLNALSSIGSTGSNNTAVGYQSLKSNTIGGRNTAIGTVSLENNTSGGSNTVIGQGSLRNNTTGSANTAIGDDVLFHNITGSYNTAVGFKSGFDLSGNSSSNNTFLGHSANIDSSSNTYNFSTAVGSFSTIDASNQIVLGRSSEKVKIPGSYVGINGVYNPTGGYTLDVSGNLQTTMDASINGVTVGRGGGNNQFNTAIGWISLANNTSGSSNTAVGYYSLINNTSGVDNTAIGGASLQLNTSGSFNTAIGKSSLLSNKVDGNTAIGFNSLVNNTDGSFNTAVGSRSLVSNIIGQNNTAIGYESLYTNKVDGNTAIGAYSLQYNTDGSYNVAVGYNSLQLNTRGSYNVALGTGSLYNNTLGNYNTALGYGALSLDISGNFNVAIGYNSLYANTAGGNNAVGWASLANNTTGGSNVAFGYCSLFANITGNSNIAVGNSSLANSILASNNTAIGNESLRYNTIGGQNTAVGADTALDLSGNSSSYNTFLGHRANVDSSLNIYNNSTALGYNSIIDASNQMVLGGVLSGSYPGVKIPGSYVGINGVYNPSSGYALDVSGNGRFSNSIYLYTDASNSLISQNGSNLNLINNNIDGNVVISNSNYTINNTINSFIFGFDSSGNTLAFNDGTNDKAFIRWYSPNDNSSYLEFGTKDNALDTFSEKIYFTQFEYTDSSTYARMRIDRTGVWINPTGDTNFSSVATYSLNVNGNVGIGTSASPAYALDVSGILHTNADAYINDVRVGRGGGNNQYNTVVGYLSLLNNTGGGENTAIGNYSLWQNTTGNRNTAIGTYSLTQNKSGVSNTAIGRSSLGFNTGSENTAIGDEALYNNTTGSNNTAFGFKSGFDLSGNSSYNTFLGNYTNVDISSNTYNNSTAIGSGAIIDASNQMVLGGVLSGSYPGIKIPGSYVGINGVYNPANGYALDVSGSIQFSNVLIPNYPGTTPGSSVNAIGAYQSSSLLSTPFTPGATNPSTIVSFTPNNGVWLVIIVVDFNYSSIGSDAWFRLSLSSTPNTIDFTRVNDNFASTPSNNYINLSAVIQNPNNSTTWYVVGAWGTVTTFTVPTVRVNLTRIA